jgi:Cysteine rich repeat
VRRIVSVILTAIVLLTAANAMAQQAAVRRACGAEIEQHCAGVQPGDGRIRMCVEQHFAEFSQPCKQALLQSVAVVKACKADIQRTCSGIEPGGGRIQACMTDHLAEYSAPCKRAIATAKFGNR